MSDRASTPWHIWLVGGLALIWNGFGAVNYVMTQSQNAEYQIRLTAEQLALYNSMPIWATAAWALAIWASLLGSILLLLRNRFAVLTFAVALAGLLVSLYHNLIIADATKVMGVSGTAMAAIIVLIAVALWAYSRRFRDRGVLT